MLTTMRLCERFHLTPAELAEIDIQTITDWATISRFESAMQRQGQ